MWKVVAGPILCLQALVDAEAGQPYLPHYPPSSVQSPSATAGSVCCRRGQACWPSEADVEALSNALDPGLSRNLHWNGSMNPRPAPVPMYAPSQQPLFGMNEGLRPVYVQNLTDNQALACPTPYASDVCKAATRNTPLEGWDPAFVVFPLTAAHVQTAVNFARRHHLCVAVLGTGHDYVNRHSNSDGLLIRTTLLKEIDWDPYHRGKMGGDNGAVKVGAGNNFQEVDYSASVHAPNSFVSTGWGATVGVAGWSIGGGHGPFGASKGLGVDNLVEAEIVIANGSLVTASETQNADLLWALRGGGGSTWGVITALTLRTHATPTGGFTEHTLLLNGTMCGDGEAQLNKTVDGYLDWVVGLSERWSGLVIVPQPLHPPGECPPWLWVVQFIYLGSQDDSEFQGQVAKLASAVAGVSVVVSKSDHFSTWWQRNLPTEQEGKTDAIMPFKVNLTQSGAPGGAPSVLLNESARRSPALREKIKTALLGCKSKAPTEMCTGIQLFCDIPGTRASQHFPADSTSISAGFRTANMHVILASYDMQEVNSFYEFGDHSYFGESSYTMTGDSWKHRYWGQNHDKLLAIKNKYDPGHLFWCHHCVGSDATRNAEATVVI